MKILAANKLRGLRGGGALGLAPGRPHPDLDHLLI